MGPVEGASVALTNGLFSDLLFGAFIVFVFVGGLDSTPMEGETGLNRPVDQGADGHLSVRLLASALPEVAPFAFAFAPAVLPRL